MVLKVFLEILQSLQENICVWVSACNFIKKETPTFRCFPVNFEKFLKYFFLMYIVSFVVKLGRFDERNILNW